VGHYSDFYQGAAEAATIRAHAPARLPELTEYNLRLALAERNKAQRELAELKRALGVLRAAIR
jgi:hypothetical protein